MSSPDLEFELYLNSKFISKEEYKLYDPATKVAIINSFESSLKKIATSGYFMLSFIIFLILLLLLLLSQLLL